MLKRLSIFKIIKGEIMEQLFIKQAEFEKVARKILDSDTTK